ncbi:hypothetical protein SCFA_540006 [anaerobic digester metagenome]|jgi:hypothetical protein|uniref:Uncharacterized protein n=1 Tax=anaerobic digester metagenome TaxID=1263854 RepID=A0A485M7A1_9ZZZZ
MSQQFAKISARAPCFIIIKVAINIEDAATGELFQTIIYPDVLEEIQL